MKFKGRFHRDDPIHASDVSTDLVGLTAVDGTLGIGKLRSYWDGLQDLRPPNTYVMIVSALAQMRTLCAGQWYPCFDLWDLGRCVLVAPSPQTPLGALRTQGSMIFVATFSLSLRKKFRLCRRSDATLWLL